MTADAEAVIGALVWDGRGLGVFRPIARLAAPLTAWFAIQSATSLASIGMVGRLGDAALAGLGAAGAVYSLVLALLFGVDAAVQATVSRRIGAGRAELFGQALADALAVSVPLGVLLAVGSWIAAPGVLGAMLSDHAAAAAGTGYLRAAAPSLALMALTIPVNAGWIGAGQPGLALLVTAILAPVQIAATFVFVFGAGPLAAQGAGGVGAAISFAGLAGVGLQGLLVARRGAVPGLRRAPPRPAGAASIASIGWPISLQQAFLQLGVMVAYVILARLGTQQVAAANVLISLVSVPVQLAVGLGVAAATLVGQSLGGGDAAEARRWGWRTALVGVAASAPFTLAAVCATRPLLSLFLHDPATLAIAVWPLRVAGLAIAADTLCRVLCFAIRGAGATKIGATIPFVSQWLLQLPLIGWVAVSLGFGLLGMASVQAGVAFAEAFVTVLVWSGSRWTTHKVLSRAA